MTNFEERLKGGHPNSLGNTVKVVDEVMAKNELFNELFNCYFSNDEIVRLRTSNAMKRICKAKKTVLIPNIYRFLTDIASIDQASAQWTLSQLFGMLEKEMNDKQIQQAKKIMKNNLPGFYMAEVIKRNGYEKQLIQGCENPFNIFYLYNKAAEIDPEKPFTYSKKTIEYLKNLERTAYDDPSTPLK